MKWVTDGYDRIVLIEQTEQGDIIEYQKRYVPSWEENETNHDEATKLCQKLNEKLHHANS